eukprot:3044606-Prymnesium_polylepis.1
MDSSRLRWEEPQSVGGASRGRRVVAGGVLLREACCFVGRRRSRWEPRSVGVAAAQAYGSAHVTHIHLQQDRAALGRDEVDRRRLQQREATPR